MKEKLNNRYLMLGICFVAFFIIIVMRLVNLQIVEGEKYNIDSQGRLLKESTVTAPRGKIMDRSGVPIAVNRQGFTVKIVKTNVTNDELNEILYRLVCILEKNDKSYNDDLSKYLTFNPISFNGRSVEEILKWEKNENRLNIEKDEELQDNPEGLFNYLRDVKFKIAGTYTDEQAYKIMKLRYQILINNWNFSSGGTVVLAKDVGMEVIAEIEERHHELSGIITDVEPMRQYLDAYEEAHVLGYVGAISSEQLESRKEEGYDSNDIIGKTGVELSAERYLRGKDGKKSIEVDVSGRLTEQQESVPAIPGSDVVLTIDTNLQKEAMESLKRNIEKIRTGTDKNNYGDANSGAVVAMDVNTGEVLAMASYPSYDPAVYLAGSADKTAQQTIAQLNTDVNKPQYNRAIQGTYAPGSTFKPLTAIAALETGVITPENSRRYDDGRDNFGGMDFICLEHPNSGHGWLNLKKALETSCNIYFYNIGFSTGIDNLAKWAGYFGLGKKTGIDLPSENAGNMSSKESKKERRNDDWRPADTAQVSIGQFDNLFTPLQLARYIGAIANGGKLYKPYIVKRVIKYDGSIVNETQPSFEKIPVKESTINAVKEGMVAVTTEIDGTAKEFFKDFPYTVAGKTGTAQTAGKSAARSDNALFVCYVPAEKPQIAVAVVIERGVWGSYTAPIARDVLDAYFGLNKTNTADDTLKPEEAVFTQ